MSDPITTTTPGLYVGWLWLPTTGWRGICEGDTEATTWAELLDAPGGNGCKRMVLKRGVDPGRPRRPLRR